MSIAQSIDVSLLTPQEAAKILNVHENTLRRWCDQGILKAYRIGSSAHRRIPLDQVRTLRTQMHENHGHFGRLSCLLVGWSLFGLLPYECVAAELILLGYPVLSLLAVRWVHFNCFSKSAGEIRTNPVRQMHVGRY